MGGVTIVGGVLSILMLSDLSTEFVHDLGLGYYLGGNSLHSGWSTLYFDAI